MSKIYCWINSRAPEWFTVNAMAEDGTFLAAHVSSNESWARHDIGITSDWRHDNYKAHYPDGYELEWVDEPREHAGLMSAYALNQKTSAGGAA